MPSLHFTIRSEDPWFVAQEIFDILTELLQPSSNLSLTAAAERIDGFHPAKRTDKGEKEEPASFFLELWDVYVQIAQQLPHNHPGQEKLAKLAQVLRDLPSQAGAEISSSESEMWQDLPQLSGVLVDEFHGVGFTTFPDGDANQLMLWERWRNLNAFGARLTRDGTVDLQFFAITFLSSALENEPDHRARAFHNQGPTLNCDVPIAAQWIKHCGHILIESTQVCDTWGKGGNLWKGKPSFSPERWQFWKQRFGEMREHDQVSEQTKEAAAEAYNLMVKCEKELRERDELAQTRV